MRFTGRFRVTDTETLENAAFYREALAQTDRFYQEPRASAQAEFIYRFVDARDLSECHRATISLNEVPQVRNNDRVRFIYLET